MKQYLRVASRLFNTPLMLDSRKLGEIVAAVAPRFGIEPPAIEAGIDAALELRSWPYDDAREDGIEVIEISGTLVNRYARGPSGTMSYDRIRDRVNAAVRDQKTRGQLRVLPGPEGFWRSADRHR